MAASSAFALALCAAHAETVWLDGLDTGKAIAGWGKPQKNRSLEGRLLTIARQSFERGLGTHAPSRFRIRLDGHATRFTAFVGIDDEVAKRPSKASVSFALVGDGKSLWNSGVMHRLEAPKRVDVKLDGVKVLELVVTDAGDGLACDHADWVDARFEMTAGSRPRAVAIPPQAKTGGKGRRTPGGKHQPEPDVTGTVELAALGGAGVKVLEGFSGHPDKEPWGVLGTRQLVLPPFTRGVFYSHANAEGRGWPNMMNRGYPHPFTDDSGSIAGLNDGGIFFTLALRDGGYLAIAALAGSATESWFHTDLTGRLLMSFGTFGTAPVDADVPLFAWGRDDDVYAACQAAFAAAVRSRPLRGRVRLRAEKAYPEYFKYLGWCSWEQYHGGISESVLLQAVDGIEASGLPVRYVLVDDGHTSTQRGAMSSFRPSPRKFPHGWAPLLARRAEKGIRWMGLWHDFKGYRNAISPDNDFPASLREHLEPFSATSAIPRNDPAASLAFYRAFMGSVKDYGFDFVKTDFQSAELARLAGKVENGVQRCAANSQAMETALQELGLGLINCNWHNPANYLNCRFSNVGRCSIDYSKKSLASAKSHLYQSYANSLWLCQLAWGDQDMFHSSHQGVGRIMALSKAMSGGPVYLSDAPEAFVADVIKPLCYADGEVLRPLAPAAPLPDSVFVDPLHEQHPYRVAAPLPGGSVAVVIYNLYGNDRENAPLRASVTTADFLHAGGMLQPYKGDLALPAEGLLVYDWPEHTASRLEQPYTVDLTGFADRLVLLCPIREGWAVVGRVDKYLSPAAVEVLACTPARLELRLLEAGPLAVWSAHGAPRAPGLVFTPRGGGLYQADLPVGKRGFALSLSR